LIDVPELGIFGDADREEVVLGRHDAMQPELQLAEHVDQVFFLRGRGLILFFEINDERLESFQFLSSEREDLAGEPVARSIERRALLPFLGARPGRFLRVQAISAKLRFGRRPADGSWGDCWRILFSGHE
jgi:hypothetical protein